MIFNENINAITINNIEGDVNIELNKSNSIEVICDNSEVPIKVNRGSLTIGELSNGSFSSGRNTVINGNYNNFSNVIINNGRVISGTMGGSSKEMPKANVTIKVPYNIIDKLDLSMVGKVSLEKIASTINIDTSFSVELSIDGIEAVDLDTSGQSKGTIRNVERLNMDTSGQSTFNIFNVKRLDIDGSGQTNITVKSDIIEKADIDLSGQGTVSIDAKEINTINADLSGMSNVYVTGHIGRKSIDKSGMSSFHYSEN